MSKKGKLSITIYYLVSDLFERWESEDVDAVDEKASASRYEHLLREAVHEQYPEAEIDIRQGTRPTHVESDDGDWRLEQEVQAVVDDIDAKLYAEFDWVVDQ